MVRRPHSPRCRIVRFFLVLVLTAVVGASARAQSSSNVQTMVGAVPLATAAPSIEVAATVQAIIARTGDTAVATFTRAGGDKTKKLFVYYSIKGTAKNGVDYRFINGRLKIKPNKDSARLLITPVVASTYKGLKSIKLRVRPNTAYSLGTNAEAILYISYGS